MPHTSTFSLTWDHILVRFEEAAMYNRMINLVKMRHPNDPVYKVLSVTLLKLFEEQRELCLQEGIDRYNLFTINQQEKNGPSSS